MKPKNSISKLFLLLMLASGVQAGSKDKVVYQKKTSLDFDGGNVDGQYRTPDGTGVDSDKKLGFDSLLKPPRNFNREVNRNSGAVR